MKLLESVVALNNISKKYDSIVLLFSKNLDDRAVFIKEQLGIKDVLFADIPVDISANTKAKYHQATKEVTEIVQAQEGKIDFLIAAPFFVGFPAVFPQIKGVGKFTIIYDFIPYKIWHLQRIFPDELYAQHFELFIQADHLFTISHAVKNDLIELFGFEQNKITSIDGGPFMDERSVADSVVDIKLREPYILFPSAPIVHKNNERAAKGFALFNEKNDNKYTLYITSTFPDEAQDSLRLISPQIEFTGNISDDELIGAYVHSDTVMFASMAEGLGMPVLESIVCGVPVACSDIPVLSEIASGGVYPFDPREEKSIARALDAATSKTDWDKKLPMHKAIKQKYTWPHSAKLLLDSMSIEGRVEKTLPCLLIQVEGPLNQDTPVARFIEKSYASLRARYNIVIQAMTDVEPKAPSYSAYIYDGTYSGSPDIVLRVSRKKRFLIFNDSKNIILQIDHNNKQKVIQVAAHPVTIDGALGMNSWGYNMSAQDLIEYIEEI